MNFADLASAPSTRQHVNEQTPYPGAIAHTMACENARSLHTGHVERCPERNDSLMPPYSGFTCGNGWGERSRSQAAKSW
jgi:hypothetical protein